MTEISVERGFVDVVEGQIHYRTCGADGSPVLIMVHGSPGGSRPLIPLMKELGRTDRPALGLPISQRPDRDGRLHRRPRPLIQAARAAG